MGDCVAHHHCHCRCHCRSTGRTSPRIRMTKQPFDGQPGRIQLFMAVVLTLSGILLLFAGAMVPPIGIIHSSILVAFGEVSTFAGALFGIDYHYRFGKR